jgi:hypothetical protein
MDILSLLHYTTSWTTSNRLDKIYGVLGLGSKSLQKSIVVDYAKTETELLTDIVTWYFSLREDLFILNLASSNKDEICGKPS